MIFISVDDAEGEESRRRNWRNDRLKSNITRAGRVMEERVETIQRVSRRSQNKQS